MLESLATLPPSLLEHVLQHLPVHPRQWSVAAQAFKEVSEAVTNLRQQTARSICDEHQLHDICDAGELLVTLTAEATAADGDWHTKRILTAQVLRLMVAGAPLDWQYLGWFSAGSASAAHGGLKSRCQAWGELQWRTRVH